MAFKNSFLRLGHRASENFLIPFGFTTFGIVLYLFISNLKLPHPLYAPYILIFGILIGCAAFSLSYKKIIDSKLSKILFIFVSNVFLAGIVLVLFDDLKLIKDGLINHDYLRAVVAIAGFLSFLLLKNPTSSRNIPRSFAAIVKDTIKDLGESKLFLGTLCMAILLGTSLIIYDAFKQNIHVDEALVALVAKNIGLTFKSILDSGEIYARGYIYTYPLAVIYAFFGVGVFETRIISILVSIASIFVFYILCRKAYLNRWISVGSTFVFILLPIVIQFSGFARMYSINLLIVLVLFYLLLDYSQRKKRVTLLWSGFFFLLGFLSHNIFVFSLIPFTLSILYLNRTAIIAFIKNRGLLTVIFILVMLLVSYLGLIYLESSTKVDVLSNIKYSNSIVDIFLNQYTYLSIPFLILISSSLATIVKTIYRENNYDLHALLLFNVVLSLLLIEFLIYSNFPSYRIRYIYHLVPVIVLIFTKYTLDLAKNNWGFYFVIPLVIAFAILNINFSTLENKIIPKYDLDKISIEKNDIVITNNPIVSAFYLGRADYWLMPNDNEIFLYSYQDRDLNEYNVYTNSKLITNIEEIERLRASQHGVILIDPIFANFLGNSLVKELTGLNVHSLPVDNITIVRF